jgi:hypothetical protein
MLSVFAFAISAAPKFYFGRSFGSLLTWSCRARTESITPVKARPLPPLAISGRRCCLPGSDQRRRLPGRGCACGCENGQCELHSRGTTYHHGSLVKSMRENTRHLSARRASRNDETGAADRGSRSMYRPLKWLGRESNPRHADFQSAALPTELPSRFSSSLQI